MDGGLFRTALRVIQCCLDYRNPDAGDVALLRAALPSAAGWPADEIACHIVQSTVRKRRREEAGQTAEEF